MTGSSLQASWVMISDPCRPAACWATCPLGERYNGIVEVDGSIPSGSTIQIKGLARKAGPLLISARQFDPTMVTCRPAGSRAGCANAVNRNDSIPGPLFVFKKTE